MIFAVVARRSSSCNPHFVVVMFGFLLVTLQREYHHFPSFPQELSVVVYVSQHQFLKHEHELYIFEHDFGVEYTPQLT